MSVTTISAPSFANATACERPWPRAPPVINTTFPSKRPMTVPSWLWRPACDQNTGVKRAAGIGLAGLMSARTWSRRTTTDRCLKPTLHSRASRANTRGRVVVVNIRGEEVLLPTTIVGSYPRAQFLEGKVFPIGGVNAPEFPSFRARTLYRNAVALAIKDMTDVGLDVVTDGCQH